uniref:Uncharacterized protein n=1 Tax=Serinus canaria TaxID=9135 RepID=A0A8C9MWA3_SERCA
NRWDSIHFTLWNVPLERPFPSQIPFFLPFYPRESLPRPGSPWRCGWPRCWDPRPAGSPGRSAGTRGPASRRSRPPPAGTGTAGRAGWGAARGSWEPSWGIWEHPGGIWDHPGGFGIILGDSGYTWGIWDHPDPQENPGNSGSAWGIWNRPRGLGIIPVQRAPEGLGLLECGTGNPWNNRARIQDLSLKSQSKQDRDSWNGLGWKNPEGDLFGMDGMCQNEL